MADSATLPSALPPSPTEAQRSSIERTDLSMAVTSGAGCGKTFVLTQRYLRLMEQSARPDAPLRIVAVTFTEKAALEMRQRVAGELAHRSDPLAVAWRSRLAQARISTIHGFCAALLRTYPVVAGVDPAFEVLADEFRRTRMRADACQRALRAALLRPPEGLLELLATTGYARALEMLEALVDERWRWTGRDYARPTVTLARWREAIRRLTDEQWAPDAVADIRQGLAFLAGAACDDPRDKLAVHLCEQVEVIAALLNSPAERTGEMFARLASAGGKGGAKAWGSREQAAQVRARLKALVERLRAMAPLHTELEAPDEQSARQLAGLTRTARDAVRRYGAAKRRAGVLDFVDLQSGARNLLRRPDIRGRVAQSIDHLLIDEFQDTDALQRELLYLAVGAQGESPPPGKLFFVGDAKQSIYRFRGAEVEVFERARQAIGAQGRRNLDLNFRTHAAGVALVNTIFSRLMGEQYEPLTARRQEPPPGPAVEVILAECPDDANAGDRYRLGARAAARRVAEMIADARPRVWDADAARGRAVRPGDVAILLPRLRHTGPFEEALDDYGVPYYVVAGAGLFHQPEVYDLVNALRAIDNPLDDVALVGFLRGGLVGLDDNALLHLAAAGSPPYRPHLRSPAVLARLSPPVARRLTWAAELLEGLSASKDARGPDALIRLLMERTGYEAALLAQRQGRRKCGNVHRVLAHAVQAAGATLREFIEFVGGLTVEEVRAEQAAVEAESGDVVRIMTIHKAKGLEFPVVVLADLNYQPQARAPELSLRGPLGLTFRPGSPADEPGQDPQSWTIAKRLDRQGELAEDLRTFYVAVTRHRDFISFVGCREHTADGALGRSGSMLRMLDDALGLSQFHVADPAGTEGTLPGGAGLLVRDVSPTGPRRPAGHSTLEGLCRQSDGPDDLGRRLVEFARLLPEAPTMPLLDAPAKPTVERTSPAAMALLAQCPARYHWQHELRVPLGMLSDDGPRQGLGRLDPLTEGAVLHRCLQLLDLARPQPAYLLARLALEERGLAIDPRELARPLEEMLQRLRAHPLWQTLATARQLLRQVECITRTHQAELLGVIDALVQTPDGRWLLVDYRSEDVPADDAPACAESCRLEIEIYTSAARRLLARTDEAPADELSATLYFLRPGVACTMDLPVAADKTLPRRLDDLAERLAACRRAAQWPARGNDRCPICPFRQVCNAQSSRTGQPTTGETRRGYRL